MIDSDSGRSVYHNFMLPCVKNNNKVNGRKFSLELRKKHGNDFKQFQFMDHGRKTAFFANHGTEKCPIYESRHNANSRITVKKIRIHSTKKRPIHGFMVTYGGWGLVNP